MKKYTPLHCHSHFSLLDGLAQPEQMAARIEAIDADSCALTDHGSVSGVVQFSKAMRDAGKKPILGCELYISKLDASVKKPENSKMSHLPVLCKNYKGWMKLIKITSASNHPDHFYRRPRLSFEQLKEYLDGNIIGFSGHLGSCLANMLISSGMDAGVRLALEMQEAFGKGNFYLETQLYLADYEPLQRKVTEMVREVGRRTGIPVIATPDAHYATQDQAPDQNILLCRGMGTNLRNGKKPEFQLNCFFNSDRFHIPSYEEMIEYGHTEEELANTLELDAKIEDFKITRKPILPPFPCPNGMDSNLYLRQLCREGWAKLIAGKVPEHKHQEYADRVKKELDIFEGADLSGYFLICQDIVNFVRDKGWLAGPGRGSAAGCLISYLIGITQVDPIPYGLLIERFYNEGRNTEDNISLPDIDMDVPVAKREEVIQHIKDRYGDDKVSQMITYQTMQGRAAVKDVFKAYADLSNDDINRITKLIPDPAKVAGELQEMKEETGDSSLIRFALEEKPADFAEWGVGIDENGNVTGELGPRFEQAMRLEGTKIIQSKHAAGVIISPEPLEEYCPMVYDTKKKMLVAGMEMNDLEALGMVKLDILGIALLDKIMGIQEILEFGDILQNTKKERETTDYDYANV